MNVGKFVCLAMSVGLIAFNALADNGSAFTAELVGSAPGEHVAGVPSSGAPWKIASGQVTWARNGSVSVQLKRLVFASGNSINTVGTITQVAASFVCGDVVVGTTRPTFITTTGNAVIQDFVQVPSPCIAPAVMIRVAANTSGPVANSAFIAVNALNGAVNDDQQDR